MKSTPTTLAPNLFCHSDMVKAGLRLGLGIRAVFGLKLDSFRIASEE